MKKLILVFTLITGMVVTAQNKRYVITSGEWIFSMADTEYGSFQPNNILRFSPWFNIQSEHNYDLSQNFGLIAGLSLRNIGFIYELPKSAVQQTVADNPQLSEFDGATVKKKFRNYTIGVPVGFKLGNLDRFYFFGGYEIELPFHYKEKTFINGSKEFKHTRWFDNSIPTFYHSAFAGVQLPGGGVIKMKYYFTDFFNQDYVQRTGTDSSQKLHWNDTRNFYPTKAGLFYVSLTYRLFRDAKFYYNDKFDSTTYSMLSE